MDLTSFTVKLALLLLPGIFGALLYDKLTIHRPWKQFRYALYILIISISAYVLLDVLYSLINLFRCKNFLKLHFWDDLFQPTSSGHLIEVFWAVIVSFQLSIVLTYLRTHGLIYKFFQRINVSNKYGSESLFYRVMEAKDVDWIYLRDKNNKLTYLGQIAKYSEDEQNREIVLYNVTVYNYPESQELYKVEKIYLSFSLQTELHIEIPD